MYNTTKMEKKTVCYNVCVCVCGMQHITTQFLSLLHCSHGATFHMLHCFLAAFAVSCLRRRQPYETMAFTMFIYSFAARCVSHLCTPMVALHFFVLNRISTFFFSIFIYLLFFRNSQGGLVTRVQFGASNVRRPFCGVSTMLIDCGVCCGRKGERCKFSLTNWVVDKRLKF